MNSMIKYKCLTCQGEFCVEVKYMHKKPIDENFYEATCNCPYCKADNVVVESIIANNK